MLNRKRLSILTLAVVSIVANPLYANSNTLTVDQGVVLKRSSNGQSSDLFVLKGYSQTSSQSQAAKFSERGNFTTIADESDNAQASDNLDVDGRNIQPVPDSIIKPIPLTNDIIPSRQDIIIEPGVNTLIPISINQINRIVTPFEHPTVQRLKLNNVIVNVQGNVVYVSTSSTNPVALYISEKGDESVAISLSLVPQKIAPIQATLMLSRKLNNAGTTIGVSPAGSFFYGGSEVKARRWEQKDNYVETIRNIMRTIALGDIPPGYSMGNLSRGISVPNCNFHTGTVQDDIKYIFSGGQYMQGSLFSVIVGVAQNTGSSTVTIDESLCTHPNLAARALWSRNTLQPGQKTEAFFVIRNTQPSEQTTESMRPKLAE
ncbi:TraK domain-containing protein [Photorhabdus bodei]|uniref:Type-F conjugative transfer system secretin TraK n=1 Tax=Photorhabdus bodei TaxID=2029681 RepID=A0AAW6BMG4_9GAMM|nr:type-F conjugative transfer system secretin TraK [Photorhabdus bodei]MDB6373951.1 type-F conjugative transfer system secretin TraK [Photorhabdus bodei]